MSADNAVAILETAIYPPADLKKSPLGKQACPAAKEYRVSIVSAIGNAYQSRKFLYQMFQTARVFDTLEEAQFTAKIIQRQIRTEYGVIHIKDFANILWDDIERKYRKKRADNRAQDRGDCLE